MKPNNILTISLIALTSSICAEDLYQLEVEGTISWANSQSGILQVGLPLSGTLVYDADTVDQDSSTEYSLFANAGKSISWSYNNGELTGNATDLDIRTRVFKGSFPWGEFTADVFGAFNAKSFTAPDLGEESFKSVSILLEAEDFNGRDNYFKDGELPKSFPSAADFSLFREIAIQWGTPMGGPPPEYAVAQINSINVSAIPANIEPWTDSGRPNYEFSFELNQETLSLFLKVFTGSMEETNSNGNAELNGIEYNVKSQPFSLWNGQITIAKSFRVKESGSKWRQYPLEGYKAVPLTLLGAPSNSFEPFIGSGNDSGEFHVLNGIALNAGDLASKIQATYDHVALDWPVEEGFNGNTKPQAGLKVTVRFHWEYALQPNSYRPNQKEKKQITVPIE